MSTAVGSAGRVAVAMISMNEEEAVGTVIESIRRQAPDASIVIVDSSTDRTAEIAESLGARVVRQLPPRGYGPAMMRVLEEAATAADVVITLDCDGTYPTELIPELARLVLEEGWDVVNATRLAARPAAMPIANWAANKVFALTTRALHGLDVSDVHTGMRAYRASMLREVTFDGSGAALPVELIIKPARLGYRVTEIAIKYRERIGTTTLNRFDSTVWTFKRIVRLLGTGHRVRH